MRSIPSTLLRIPADRDWILLRMHDSARRSDGRAHFPADAQHVQVRESVVSPTAEADNKGGSLKDAVGGIAEIAGIDLGGGRRVAKWKLSRR